MNATDIKSLLEARSQTVPGFRDGDWKQLFQKYQLPFCNRVFGANSLGIRPSIPFPMPPVNAADLEVLNGVKGVSPVEIETLKSLFAFKVGGYLMRSYN